MGRKGHNGKNIRAAQTLIKSSTVERDAATERAASEGKPLSAWTRELWKAPPLTAAMATALLPRYRSEAREWGADGDAAMLEANGGELRRGLAALILLEKVAR